MGSQRIPRTLETMAETTASPLAPSAETFVVTLGIDYADGKQPGRIIYELCRGDEVECLALMYRISTPSNDRRSINHWWLTFGPLDAWEDFMSAQP